MMFLVNGLNFYNAQIRKGKIIMFHVFKQHRLYTGFPYCGPTSNFEVAEYDTLEKAKEARDKFQKENPIGWNIFNAETGELVEGHQFF